jgi:hypothetical protein
VQYPDTTEISIQSDNALWLPSYDIIAYIHHSIKELEGLGLTVVQWLYTEAQRGKGRLETHFSFVDIMFKAFVESGNIRTEQQINDALCHNGGLVGSIAVLVYGARLGVDEAAENRKNKKGVRLVSNSRNTGVRETHII